MYDIPVIFCIDQQKLRFNQFFYVKVNFFHFKMWRTAIGTYPPKNNQAFANDQGFQKTNNFFIWIIF